ncbi:glycosyltransferase family 4 protein [Bailinhaonella thermotolerans]|uniref:glycosyltransferase family 4 protein n=1 Tax=Bailinhaonella thermotolerans TaxID=1070861 RepID=UPI00268F2A22
MVAQAANAGGYPLALPGPEAAAPPFEEPWLGGVRVAVLNFREPGQSVAGGAEEYAWQVCRYLVSRGARVDFVTGREPGQPRTEVLDGITLHRMGGKFSVYALAPLWLARHRRSFDIVIDCMNGIPFFAPAVVPRRVPVISMVHHVHDRQFYAFLPHWLARIGCFIEGPVAHRLYRNCTTVTVSESSRTELREKLGWRAPIHVIPNGSPIAAEIGEGTAAGDPAVVYLGRLVVHKRVERVVDLAETLAPDWPGMHVHVVGRGPELEPLSERVAAKGLRDRVHLHGFLDDPEKNAVLASARLAVTASEFEGWGLTVIEAAALGVPTVAYDVPGLRDSVKDGETGWLVRDGEDLPGVVSRALKELADPERREEVRRACTAWAREFTWGKTGSSMTSLIAAELAKSTKRPSSP